MQRISLTIVSQFYSGFEESVASNKWMNNGSPAFYNFIKEIDLKEDIEYQLFLLSTKYNNTSQNKFLGFSNLRAKSHLVAYFPFLRKFSKVNFIINKTFQYIFLLSKIEDENSIIYTDRDNIFLCFLVLFFSRRYVVLRLLGVTKELYAHTLPRKKLYSFIVRSVLKNNRCLIVSSNDGSYAEKVGSLINNQRYKLLFNGIDNIDKPIKYINNKTVKTFKLIYISRFVTGKGQKEFIDFLKNFQFKEKLQVFFIGDGPTKELCEEKVTKNNLDNTCYFLGKRPHHNVIKELKESDLLVSINFHGSYGNSVLEASVIGIPIITLAFDPIFQKNIDELPNLKNRADINKEMNEFMISFISNENFRERCRNMSIDFAKKNLMEWASRIDFEIDLIKKFVR